MDTYHVLWVLLDTEGGLQCLCQTQILQTAVNTSRAASDSERKMRGGRDMDMGYMGQTNTEDPGLCPL